MDTQNYIVEHFKAYGRLPKLGKFEFEDSLSIAGRKLPDEALAWLKNRGKNLKLTMNWDDMDAAAHNKAFTVAKVQSADMLQHIYNYVETAKKEGWTVSTFKQKLIPSLDDAGLSGLAPSRLNTIYNTNLQMSYAQGQNKSFKLVSDIYPYWRYRQIQRSSKRHNHSLFHNKRFKHNDSIWNSIYPPSDFYCGCSVIPEKDDSDLQYGKNYKDTIADCKDFQISPLKSWTPDTSKYVSGIRTELEKMLKSIKTVEVMPDLTLPVLPSCTKQEFAKGWKSSDERGAAVQFLGDNIMTKEQLFKLFSGDLYDGIDGVQTCTFKEDFGRFVLEYRTSDVSIIRTFDTRDNTVDHAFYKIKNTNLKGKSNYKPVFVDQLALYKKLGYETVTIHADIDVGCWAWGKYGFKFQEMDSSYNFKKLAELCKTDQSTIVKYFEPDSYFYKNCQNLMAKYNIAEKDFKEYIVKNEIGWQGYIDLTDQSQIDYGIKYARKPK